MAKSSLRILSLPLGLSKNFTNALNFEHTILIDDFVEYLFINQGFEIIEKILFRSQFFLWHSN